MRDRGEERPSGGPDGASVHGPRRRGAMQNDGRPPPIIRLAGRPVELYTDKHASPNISRTLAFAPCARTRARARLLLASSSSLCATTATRRPVSRVVQACTGVGFMFAELVGNSCRLTYSYCPARCNSPRRLRRTIRCAPCLQPVVDLQLLKP